MPIVTRLVVVAAVLPFALGLVAGEAAAAPSKQLVVRKAHNAQLGRTILVNPRGLSLYGLSVERKGKFICTDSTCLSLWKPLLIAPGKRPAGARSLGTVKRPNGKRQVTYRGRPLYRFVEDRRRGDVRGEGFRDVGVWRAARA